MYSEDEDGDDEGVSLGEGKVIHHSQLALKITLVDHDKALWIPRSVIHDDSEVYDESDKGREGKVVVKLWWAEKEGLA